MIWLWLLACGEDSDLARKRRALDAWTTGREQLDAGQATAAIASFQQARDAQPDDTLLMAWQARAMAADGRLEEAVDLLELVVRVHPHFAEARYNRAAYLTRLGRLEEAGPELARAIEDGAARSRQAMVDPDFAPHLDDPAFAFLPDEVLLVALDAPEEALFWGSEATVRFRIAGGEGAPATVEAEQLSGPLELVEVLEDVVESTEGVMRDLTWTFKVRGAGDVVLGPFTIRSGPFTTQVRAVEFPTTAPPGKSGESLLPEHLAVPASVGEGMDLPGVRRTEGRLDVKLPPGAKVKLDPPAAQPPIRYELRDRSRPMWTLQRYRAAPGVEHRVTVLREGKVLLEE